MSEICIENLNFGSRETRSDHFPQLGSVSAARGSVIHIAGTSRSSRSRRTAADTETLNSRHNRLTERQLTLSRDNNRMTTVSGMSISAAIRLTAISSALDSPSARKASAPTCFPCATARKIWPSSWAMVNRVRTDGRSERYRITRSPLTVVPRYPSAGISRGSMLRTPSR